MLSKERVQEIARSFVDEAELGAGDGNEIIIVAANSESCDYNYIGQCFLEGIQENRSPGCVTYDSDKSEIIAVL
jgi:hypothetical protein